jgi:uncharacterized protein involved in exopolysaccharide biosynthesis
MEHCLAMTKEKFAKLTKQQQLNNLFWSANTQQSLFETYLKWYVSIEIQERFDEACLFEEQFL